MLYSSYSFYILYNQKQQMTTMKIFLSLLF